VCIDSEMIFYDINFFAFFCFHNKIYLLFLIDFLWKNKYFLLNDDNQEKTIVPKLSVLGNGNIIHTK